MLVLTRKIQQQIQIGDNIRITILQVKGRSVRVGIEAPRDLRVSRVDAKTRNDVSESVTMIEADIAPPVAPETEVAAPHAQQCNRVEPFFASSRQSRSELKRMVAASAARRGSAGEMPLMIDPVLAAHAAC